MATTCNYCGYRSNEVKSGSGVSETGTRIKLRIMNISDLNRDVVLVSFTSVRAYQISCIYVVSHVNFRTFHTVEIKCTRDGNRHMSTMPNFVKSGL